MFKFLSLNLVEMVEMFRIDLLNFGYAVTRTRKVQAVLESTWVESEDGYAATRKPRLRSRVAEPRSHFFPH